MHLSLQIYLIEHYTKPGDWILDPMGGSGTILVGCSIGRDICYVELESKFVDMAKANWEKIKSLGPMLGYPMGTATILCGDSRNLDGLLATHCIFSPPYAETTHHTDDPKDLAKYTFGINKSARMAGTAGQSKNNIGNLPYGQIDKVVFSPPFSEQMQDVKWIQKNQPRRYRGTHNSKKQNPSNIGNLPYGSISTILTSPPYSGILTVGGDWVDRKKLKETLLTGKKQDIGTKTNIRYNMNNPSNIGNLKSSNYLAEMLKIYQQCHKVLRDGGLLILVVKSFIRNKKIVDLAADTIKLCEQCGFVLKERLARKLTQKSFWRILYERKYPTVARIDSEDILIFTKSG